jgi:hypothetical protein
MTNKIGTPGTFQKSLTTSNMQSIGASLSSGNFQNVAAPKPASGNSGGESSSNGNSGGSNSSPSK